MEIKCKNCGNINNGSTNFCKMCFAKLDPELVKEAQLEMEEKNKGDNKPAFKIKAPSSIPSTQRKEPPRKTWNKVEEEPPVEEETPVEVEEDFRVSRNGFLIFFKYIIFYVIAFGLSVGAKLILGNLKVDNNIAFFLKIFMVLIDIILMFSVINITFSHTKTREKRAGFLAIIIYIVTLIPSLVVNVLTIKTPFYLYDLMLVILGFIIVSVVYFNYFIAKATDRPEKHTSLTITFNLLMIILTVAAFVIGYLNIEEGILYNNISDLIGSVFK